MQNLIIFIITFSLSMSNNLLEKNYTFINKFFENPDSFNLLLNDTNLVDKKEMKHGGFYKEKVQISYINKVKNLKKEEYFLAKNFIYRSLKYNLEFDYYSHIIVLKSKKTEIYIFFLFANKNNDGNWKLIGIHDETWDPMPSEK